ANKRYYWRVRAHNGKGYGAWSAGVSAKTKPEAPNRPSWGSTTRVGTDKATIKWSNNPTSQRPISRNRVQYNSSINKKWATNATVGASTTSYTASGLATNRVYWYRVRAEGPGGHSAWVTGGTIATPPAAPSGVSARKS